MAVGTLKQVILFSKGTSLSHGVMGEMAEIEAYIMTGIAILVDHAIFYTILNRVDS